MTVKKTLCLILTLLMVFSISGCGSTQNKTASVESKESVDAKADDPLRISMPNVTNKTLPDAVQVLEDCGFINISSTTTDSNWIQERWIVIGQNYSEGDRVLPSDSIVLTCAKQCQLYIDVKSDNNLMFNKYDVELFIEDKEIGTVANGNGFTKLLSLLEGQYSFVAYKSGDHSVSTTKIITLSGDMTFQCDIKHDKSNLEFRNINTIDNIEGSSLVMLNTTNMVLSEAMAQLSALGFSNVREEPYADIWNRDNWIIVSQNVNAGDAIDKNTAITLECISLDEYFNNEYKGKNSAEVLSMAAASGFSVMFKDSSGTDQTDRITKAEDDEKADWVVIKASQYSGRTASVVVEFTGETPEPTETPTPEPKPTQPADLGSTQSDSNSDDVNTPEHYVSYHSSHDLDIAKKGNSGVFAYSTIGGSYDIYVIIDLDEGYVYRFLSNEDSCDRVKISYDDSGDGLGQVIVVTYHVGNDVWQEGFHFKWSRQPDHLVHQDYAGFETDFYTTDLEAALKLRLTKHLVDY